MKLHNTLTGTLEELRPISKDHVTIYTCGPTVYSEPHVGNWVAFIRWDLLVRTLLLEGYTIQRVMNITDVGHLTSDADEGEDKILKGAQLEGISEWDVAERYTKSFLDGMAQLNLLPPEYLTRATDHIDIQIELVKKLEDKGYTYALSDGVYFDTARFETYADFAHLNLDEQRAGARVAQTEGKRNPSDFVLWRLNPVGETRAMQWESPWGIGIPGWHIECSAMAMKYLGETIDIHTGGIDHIPVHHTNEIAQSEASSEKRFANYWLHANFITVQGTKISKSLNNGYTLSDLAKKGYSAMDFRMFILQSHYKTESNFSWENIDAGKNRLANWKLYACLRHQQTDETSTLTVAEAIATINACLQNDLSTPEALVAAEVAMDHVRAAQDITQLVEYLDDAFGLELASSTPDLSPDMQALLVKRSLARMGNDWQTSDSVRDELSINGIGVNDSASSTTWFWL